MLIYMIIHTIIYSYVLSVSITVRAIIHRPVLSNWYIITPQSIPHTMRLCMLYKWLRYQIHVMLSISYQSDWWYAHIDIMYILFVKNFIRNKCGVCLHALLNVGPASTKSTVDYWSNIPISHSCILKPTPLTMIICAINLITSIWRVSLKHVCALQMHHIIRSTLCYQCHNIVLGVYTDIMYVTIVCYGDQ